MVGRSASEAEQLLLLSPFDRQVRREEELAIDIPGLGALDDRFDNPGAEPRETQEASEMGPAAPFALADLVKAELGVGLDKLQSGVRVSQQGEQVVFHWLYGRSAIDPQLRFAERLAGRKGNAETPAWLIGEPKSGGLEGKIQTAALHPDQRNQRSDRSLCIAWLRQAPSEELGSLEHGAEQVGLFKVRQPTQAVIIAEQHSKVMQNMPVEQALRKPG